MQPAGQTYARTDLTARDKVLLQKHQKDITALERRLDQYRRENTAQKKELFELTNRCDRLASSLTDQEVSNAQQHPDDKLLKGNATRLEEENAKLREELKVVAAERDELKAKLDDHNNMSPRKHSLRLQLNRLQERYDSLLDVRQRAVQRYKADYKKWRGFYNWLNRLDDDDVENIEVSSNTPPFSKAAILNKRKIIANGDGLDRLKEILSFIDSGGDYLDEMPKSTSKENKENRNANSNTPRKRRRLTTPLSNATPLVNTPVPQKAADVTTAIKVEDATPTGPEKRGFSLKPFPRFQPQSPLRFPAKITTGSSPSTPRVKIEHEPQETLSRVDSIPPRLTPSPSAKTKPAAKPLDRNLPDNSLGAGVFGGGSSDTEEEGSQVVFAPLPTPSPRRHGLAHALLHQPAPTHRILFPSSSEFGLNDNDNDNDNDIEVKNEIKDQPTPRVITSPATTHTETSSRPIAPKPKPKPKPKSQTKPLSTNTDTRTPNPVRAHPRSLSSSPLRPSSSSSPPPAFPFPFPSYRPDAAAAADAERDTKASSSNNLDIDKPRPPRKRRRSSDGGRRVDQAESSNATRHRNGNGNEDGNDVARQGMTTSTSTSTPINRQNYRPQVSTTGGKGKRPAADSDYSAYKGRGRYAPSASASKSNTGKTINALYAIDPQRNGGLDFQYDEVVRAKADRRRLDAGDCECCRDYYEAIGPLPKRLQQPLWRSPPGTPAKPPCGRHHHRRTDGSRSTHNRVSNPADPHPASHPAPDPVPASDFDFESESEFEHHHHQPAPTQKEQEITSHKHGISRHRHRWARAHTPPGYWNIGFPSTQEAAEINERAEEMHRRKREDVEREVRSEKGKYVRKR